MDDIIVCRCQEISQEEILAAVADGARSPDGVKRRTGAGMGLCQGRSCRKLVTALIAREQGVDPANIEPASVRPPVRPVTVESLTSLE